MKRMAILVLAIYAGSIFLESLSFGALGSLTRIIGYFAFTLGVMVMLSQRGINRPEWGHVLLTLFVCVSFFSVLWSVDVDMTLDRTLMYTMQLAMLWLVLQLIDTAEDINTVLGGYVVGALAACAGNVYVFHIGQQVVAHSGRYSSTALDPNEFALCVVLAVPMAWYLGFSARRPLARLFFRLSLLVMAPGIILTGSRAGLIALLVSLLVIPLCFKQVSSFTKATVLVVVIATLSAGLSWLPQDAVKRFSSIGDEVIQGSMAGRRELWAAGWEQFKQHPLLGVGCGGFPEAISVASITTNVAHNTYLSVATELGTVGFLVWVMCLGCLGFDVLHMPKPQRWVWGTVLLSWMVGVSALTWEYTKPTWLLFAMLMAQARLSRENMEGSAEQQYATGTPRSSLMRAAREIA
jgi:O-antigen ligase